MHGDIWQLQEVKANPGAIIRAARRRRRPQFITVRGRKEAVVMPYREEKTEKPIHEKFKPRTLLDVMAEFPDIGLTRKELKEMFGRSRSTKLRGTDERLFD